MNTACIIVNPKVNSIDTQMTNETPGARSIETELLMMLAMFVNHGTDSFCVRDSGGNDSGNERKAMTRENTDNTLATKHGSRYGWVSKMVPTNQPQRAAGSESSPPMNGPNIKI